MKLAMRVARRCKAKGRPAQIERRVRPDAAQLRDVGRRFLWRRCRYLTASSWLLFLWEIDCFRDSDLNTKRQLVGSNALPQFLIVRVLDRTQFVQPVD